MKKLHLNIRDWENGEPNPLTACGLDNPIGETMTDRRARFDGATDKCEKCAEAVRED